MVSHTFNPRTWKAEANRFLRVPGQPGLQSKSRTAKATQRNPVSKERKEGREKEERKKEKSLLCVETEGIVPDLCPLVCLSFLSSNKPMVPCYFHP